MTQLQMKGAMIQDRKIRKGDERKLQKSPIEIDHLNSEDLKKYSLCTLAMDTIQFDKAVLSKCTFCLAICHSGGLGMSAQSKNLQKTVLQCTVSVSVNTVPHHNNCTTVM